MKKYDWIETLIFCLQQMKPDHADLSRVASILSAAAASDDGLPRDGELDWFGPVFRSVAIESGYAHRMNIWPAKEVIHGGKL